MKMNLTKYQVTCKLVMADMITIFSMFLHGELSCGFTGVTKYTTCKL
jgi:hypothetical protein